MTDAEAIQRISDVIVAGTAMERAPQIFVAESSPNKDLQDAAGKSKFCIVWPSTATTSQYRDDGLIRQRHRVQVGFVRRLKMADQFQGLLDSAGVEEKIKAAMGAQSRLSPLRATFVDVTRRQSTSREHLIVYVNFDVFHDFYRTT